MEHESATRHTQQMYDVGVCIEGRGVPWVWGQGMGVGTCVGTGVGWGAHSLNRFQSASVRWWPPMAAAPDL